jgi:hypothetical protein
LPAGAWAGTACQAGTLSTLVAQGQCTIGNLDFNFLTASLIYGLPRSTPTDESGIGFVPLVSAGMQGFRLTGPLSGNGYGRRILDNPHLILTRIVAPSGSAAICSARFARNLILSTTGIAFRETPLVASFVQRGGYVLRRCPGLSAAPLLSY